jgi:hypothetical protein
MVNVFFSYFAYLLFCCYIFTMNLLNKKKEYFIQKVEITPKWLEIGIHNVNKSGLRIKFYIHI